MSPEIQNLLEKARRSLRSARRLADGGDHDFAASRAYYAMFYAAEALLLHRGLAFSRHTGVISELNRLFVRTGEIDPRHLQALSEGLNERLVGDYGFQIPFPAATAERMIHQAEAFIEIAETWLRQQPPEAAA